MPQFRGPCAYKSWVLNKHWKLEATHSCQSTSHTLATVPEHLVLTYFVAEQVDINAEN